MRFWIFLKLAFVDLMKKLGFVLALAGCVAAFFAAVAAALWGIGRTATVFLPDVAIPMLSSVKGYEEFVAGGSPIEFPLTLGICLTYLVVLPCLAIWTVYAMVKGICGWIAGTWYEAGYEANRLKQLKKAAAAVLVGIGALLAVLFGSGCDRIDAQRVVREQFPTASMESVPSSSYEWIVLDGTNLYYARHCGAWPNEAPDVVPLFGAPAVSLKLDAMR